MLAHFLAVGDLIEQKIKSDLPDAFKLVAHAADLAGVQDSAQVHPACHIVYLGHRAGPMIRSERPPSMRKKMPMVWEQDWMTVIVVRSSKDAKQLTGAMAIAGPLAGQLANLLADWKPTEGVEPLEPVAPGVPPLPSSAGTLYFPLRWRVAVKSFS